MIDLFDGERVNLVVDIEASDVGTLTLNHIDKLIHCRIATEENFSIKDLCERQGETQRKSESKKKKKAPYYTHAKCQQ